MSLKTVNIVHCTYLVIDGTAAVLEDDLADGVGGGEEGVVGEAVGGEDPVEVGHQRWGELGLWNWKSESESMDTRAEVYSVSEKKGKWKQMKVKVGTRR